MLISEITFEGNAWIPSSVDMFSLVLCNVNELEDKKKKLIETYGDTLVEKEVNKEGLILFKII